MTLKAQRLEVGGATRVVGRLLGVLAAVESTTRLASTQRKSRMNGPFGTWRRQRQPPSRGRAAHSTAAPRRWCRRGGARGRDLVGVVLQRLERGMDLMVGHGWTVVQAVRPASPLSLPSPLSLRGGEEVAEVR